MRSHSIEIFETTDYEIFTKLNGNRDLIPNHYKQMAEDLKNHNFIQDNHIVVNDRFQVIDGQHRLEAAKTSQVPVYYEIKRGRNLTDAIEMNAKPVKWSMYDYLKSYAEQGVTNYVLLYELYNRMHTQYGVYISTVLELCCDNYNSASSNRSKKVLSGSDAFKRGFAQTTKDSISKGEKDIHDLVLLKNEYLIENTLRVYFARSYKMLTSQSDFKREIFFHKLNRQRKKLVGCANTRQVLEALLEIYNNRNSKPINIKGYRQY